MPRAAVEAAGRHRCLGHGNHPSARLRHEDPSQSFVLDIADLFRDSVLVPAAFRAAKQAIEKSSWDIERLARRETGSALTRSGTIPKMIARIKDLFGDSQEA